MSEVQIYSENFIQKVEEFRQTIERMNEVWKKKMKEISEEKTPKSRIYTRPDGYDYIPEKYMRNMLDNHFPGWSWVQSGEFKVITEKIPLWVVVSGTLVIPDEYLITLGLEGGVRKFFSIGAARIQYKTKEKIRQERKLPNGQTVFVEKEVEIPLEGRYNPWNLIDLDKSVASANTNAFKRAINRLCHIGDDVYGKRADDELTSEQLEKLNQILESAPEKARQWAEERMDKVTPENFDRFINKLNQIIKEEEA